MRITLLIDQSCSEFSFERVWYNYLPNALRDCGIIINELKLPVDFSDKEGVGIFLNSINTEECDHIIGLGLRFFTKTPLLETLDLKRRLSGCLSHIYDGGMLDNEVVDITLTIKNDDWLYPPGSENLRYSRHLKNNKYIGWAADSEILFPNQSDEKLVILIDHSAFNATQVDQTLSVLMNVRLLVENDALWKRYGYKEIHVQMITDGKVSRLNMNEISVSPYKKNSIPFNDIVDFYNSSHIFMVTHNETVGLSMLEAAVAGAIVVTPKNLAPPDRLETINNVITSGLIDWGKVLNAIDPVKNSNVAKINSWNKVANNIIHHLSSFNKQYY